MGQKSLLVRIGKFVKIGMCILTVLKKKSVLVRIGIGMLSTLLNWYQYW